MTGATPKRLYGIEALRGVAATAVVLCHAARHIDKALTAPWLIDFFQAGHAGVDLFFTISGFIILSVHRRDVGRSRRLGHYLGRRFNRVFPTYWVALSLTIALGMLGTHGAPPLSSVIWSTTLLPTMRDPLLGIAWTLQFEVVFYALFAVLILSRNVGIALLAAWLVWIAAAAAGWAPSAVPPAVCGIYGLEFFMGMAAAQLFHMGWVPAPRSSAGIALTLLVTSLVMESVGLLDGFGDVARFAYGLPAAMLVMSVAAAEQAGHLAVPQWLRRLGGASYSIYLFQFVFIGVLWQAVLVSGLERRLPSAVLFLVLAGAAVAGGLLMSRVVEQPLLRVMRGARFAAAPQRA